MRRLASSCDLKQQRAGAAGRVVDGLVVLRGGADADDLGHDPRDFGGRVELPLLLPDSVAKWRIRYS